MPLLDDRRMLQKFIIVKHKYITQKTSVQPVGVVIIHRWVADHDPRLFQRIASPGDGIPLRSYIHGDVPNDCSQADDVHGNDHAQKE